MVCFRGFGKNEVPNAFDGVISGSAPIWSFANMEPAYNYNAFDKSVTDDASSFGGATDYCKTNLKSAWPLILEQGQSAEGRTLLQTAFRSCQAIQTEQDAMQIVSWASSVWGTLAMGNYYYESSYLMHGKSLLPAWPVRVACKALDRDFDVKTEMTALFEAVRESAAVVFNNTGDKTCFDILEPPPDRRRLGGTARNYHRTNTLERQVGKDACVGSWDFQWCTEMVQPFTEGTDEDMFYCAPGQNCSVWNYQASFENCQNVWGVTPRPEWAELACWENASRAQVTLCSRTVCSILGMEVVFSKTFPTHSSQYLFRTVHITSISCLPHPRTRTTLMFCGLAHSRESKFKSGLMAKVALRVVRSYFNRW